MQAVVPQQDASGRVRLTGIATKLLRVRQRTDAAIVQYHLQLACHHGVGPGLAVTACGQGAMAVEEIPGIGDDLGAPHRVVGAAALGAVILGDHVRAVQGVVKAAPARVGGVQGVAGVHHRHHQLGACQGCHLRIHVFSTDRKVFAFRQQIADFGQEGLVGGAVVPRPRVGLVPRVYFRLQVFPDSQQARGCGAPVHRR